jgi:hypothetical protein
MAASLPTRRAGGRTAQHVVTAQHGGLFEPRCCASGLVSMAMSAQVGSDRATHQGISLWITRCRRQRAAQMTQATWLCCVVAVTEPRALADCVRTRWPLPVPVPSLFVAVCSHQCPTMSDMGGGSAIFPCARVLDPAPWLRTPPRNSDPVFQDHPPPKARRVMARGQDASRGSVANSDAHLQLRRQRQQASA